MYAQLNPILLLFLSYGLGALLTVLIKAIGLYDGFKDHNYISDQLTRKLGVLALGWLIRYSFLGSFNPKLVIKGKASQTSLQQLKADMTDAENSHLWGFILLSIFVFILPLFGIAWWYSLLMFLINIVFNLYLVFLQQYNKRRIDKILSRLK